MEQGKKYRWMPKDIKGIDGKIYQVFEFAASGRGWSAIQRVILQNPSDEIIVTPLPQEPGVDAYPKAQFVKIVKGENAKVQTFAKRPYVRKDGSYQILGDKKKSYEKDSYLKQQYGFIRLEEYLMTSSEEGKLPWIEEFFPTLHKLQLVKLGDVVGYIVASSKQLIEV